jgi:5-methylcytosine-specific restriction endonuclease McrA
MIRVSKNSEPTILTLNAESWKKRLLQAVADKDTQARHRAELRYRHHEIKEALLQETHGKCIYCESKIRHVSPGDIEHIKPKSLFPELCFAWTNLTLACSECNRCKLDYYHDAPLS